jgi:hypothetical protein
MLGGVGTFEGPALGATAIGALAAGLPWAALPVLADPLVFVIALVIVKLRPQGFIAGARSERRDATEHTGSTRPPGPSGLHRRFGCPGCRRLDGRRHRQLVPARGLGTGQEGDQARHRHRHHRGDRSLGQLNWQVAQLAVEQINAGGGIAGRPWSSSSRTPLPIPRRPWPTVRKLIQRDKVDVVFGGITSAMRQAIKDPIVNRGKTL